MRGTPGVELVRVAQMTASGFRVARVAPVLGRPLLDYDEREGAPPIIVIAYEEWQRRFARQAMLAGALAVLVATGSVLLLSAAGIYAMMSFTVARRRREIGIRQALGADPRRLLSGIFARASAQLGAGVAIGLLLATAVTLALSGGGRISGHLVALLLSAAGVMMTIGLLAALSPARRGLRVQPTEALREE